MAKEKVSNSLETGNSWVKNEKIWKVAKKMVSFLEKLDAETGKFFWKNFRGSFWRSGTGEKDGINFLKLKKWRISGYQKAEMAKIKVSKWSDIHLGIYEIRTNEEPQAAWEIKMCWNGEENGIIFSETVWISTKYIFWRRMWYHFCWIR